MNVLTDAKIVLSVIELCINCQHLNLGKATCLFV